MAKAATGDPVHDVDLHPGDVLYLPRGWIHAAEANDGTSLHLTFGVHPYTRIDVLRAMLAELEQEPSFRASLPLGEQDGFDVGLASLASADAEAVLRRMRRRWLDDSRPAPVRAIETEAALTSIAAGTVVRLRPHLYAQRRGASLEAGDTCVVIPPGLEAAADLLIDGEPHALDDIPELLDLARTLVRHGVLTLGGGAPTTPRT